MTKHRYKRRKKLIKPRLQLKIVATFVCLACISVLIQTIVFNLALIKLSKTTDLDTATMLVELPNVLTSSLMVSLALLLPAMIIVGIMLTFRIAGPVYRFETYLRATANGEKLGPCRLRARDELHELCGLINEALARARADGDLEEAEPESAGDAAGEAA